MFSQIEVNKINLSNLLHIAVARSLLGHRSANDFREIPGLGVPPVESQHLEEN